jgi:hypothetical protein
MHIIQDTEDTETIIPIIKQEDTTLEITLEDITDRY